MTEDQLQAECFMWAYNTYPQLRKLLFHVPNGGLRNRREANKLKAMGVTPGIPDLVLFWKGRLYGFELKVGDNTTSDDQDEAMERWTEHGATCYVVRDEDTFQSLIKSIIQ